MKIKNLFLIIIILSGSPALIGNDSVVLDKLLSGLRTMQITQHSEFVPGQFPSFREYHLRRGIYKNDANSFYTGLVGFTLRGLLPYFDQEQQKIALTVLDKADSSYNWFRNQKGRNTYNYWKTNPPEIFPNSGWLNWFNKSQALPDDLDVTSIVMLAKDHDTSSVHELHRIMQEFKNGSKKTIKNTFREYKSYPAYSTWFGNKMPVDFDICVLANVLYMVNSYGIPYSQADSASQKLIGEMVKNRHHITDPEYISPYYARSPVILYHLSRLMAEFHIPELELYREILIRDAKELYNNGPDFFDKLILSTALYRWGIEPGFSEFHLEKSLFNEVEESNFVFFIANMACILPNPLNTLLGKSSIGKFYYYCPAYNTVLLIENIIWKRIYDDGRLK